MLYLARGKRGGEPTAPYEEDPTGLTTKVRAQLVQGGRLAVEPLSTIDGPPLKRKETWAEWRNAVAVTPASSGGSQGNGGGGGGSSNQQAAQSHRQPDAGHPKKRGTLYITTREGAEICFNFARGDRDKCPEPCRCDRAHVCQSWAAPQCRVWSSEQPGQMRKRGQGQVGGAALAGGA